MNTRHIPVTLVTLLAGAAVHADVTVQEQLNLEVAVIKAHGTSTKRVTSDKERTATEFSCDGLMSMLCGKNSSLEIVRLDRDVILSGEPKKKSYTETPFPTAEQRRALEERMKAAMEKLKSCPTPTPAPGAAGVDTSKCQMSPPVMNVTKADDIMNIAGHDAHHTILTMTQSCANKDTGDSCDMAYTFDVWLANREVPGLADRRAFDQNYLRKLGLDDVKGLAPPAQMSQFLAPYMDAMKKLGSQSSDLQGYPLKTTFRVAFGGAHCAAAAGTAGTAKGSSSGGVLADASAAAAGAAASSTESAADSAASSAASQAAGNSIGGSIAGSAAGAFTSKLLGGLFNKKKAAETPPPKATGAAEAPANSGLTTIAEFTVATTAIGTEAIPADQFEMPADWKKIIPKEKGPPELPNCPKTGG